MKRILVWSLYQLHGDSQAQGPAYYAERDYEPDACRLYARVAPSGGDLKIDIRADGTSIFTSNYAALNKGGNLEEHAEDYQTTEPVIAAGSIVTFHVIETNGASEITCQLEMDSLDDEESESE